MMKRMQHAEDEAIASSAQPVEPKEPEDHRQNITEGRHQRKYRHRGQSFGSSSNRGRRS